MLKVKVLVVEDESIVSKDIQNTLTKLDYQVIGAASTGEKALSLVKNELPDIVLMDIMLKGDLNGIETAKKIKASYNIPVIFLTAYADEATLNKAKLAEPYGYIIKPFKEQDLQATIEVALYKFEKDQEANAAVVSNVKAEFNDGFIFVKSNGKLLKLQTKDIYFIEALKDYVVINTIDARYTIHSTMKDIEKKMGNEEFLRIHRSFIVRIDKISAIEHPNLHLENNKKKLPIGGSYYDDLKKRIKLV